jgi:hypothetical protein
MVHIKSKISEQFMVSSHDTQYKGDITPVHVSSHGTYYKRDITPVHVSSHGTYYKRDITPVHGIFSWYILLTEK